MKKILITCCAVVALAAPVYADGHAESGTDHAGDMQKWMALMKPGDAHAAMEYFVGDWTFEHTSWMMGEEPSVSQGTASAELVLGGRYLISRAHGTMMGMPFEGMAVAGFDNGAQEHWSLWIDNFGTGYMMGAGTEDADGVLTMSGDWSEGPFKWVQKIQDDDHYVFEMHMKMGDEMGKVMEIVYSRVKSS